MSDDIQNAYLKRAINELSALNDEIADVAAHSGDSALPVLSSGSPQAEILMVKWSASIAERQEGVAFFGRAGSAILKSVQRLGLDPLTLYGTLCVKSEGAGFHEDWLAREIHIVRPTLIVPMGEPALAAVNQLGFPGSTPLEWLPGEVQRWTPASEAIVVPDIDESLDEQHAKRAFWSAFRALGDWHLAQPPY
ncbi:MAG: uracil-DNA glycosylase [Actinobacteria bacterium]|nr:uracil-DNA glycosylase [Thermoleophilia bacterium]MCB9010475.1 uracil-DNA glycosylase [Actinomycetota bacterium]